MYVEVFKSVHYINLVSLNRTVVRSYTWVLWWIHSLALTVSFLWPSIVKLYLDATQQIGDRWHIDIFPLFFLSKIGTQRTWPVLSTAFQTVTLTVASKRESTIVFSWDFEWMKKHVITGKTKIKHYSFKGGLDSVTRKVLETRKKKESRYLNSTDV